MPRVLADALNRGFAPATALRQHPPTVPIDSTVTDSPLPTGVSEMVRWLLNTVPPWMQIGGVVLGIFVVALVTVYLFRRRATLWAWVTRQTRPVHGAMVAVLLLVIVTAGIAGQASWNYTQHSNEFCTGCHVMNPAFQRFSAVTNKHQELSCHDCHQQSIFASMRQLYFWVAERPEDIGQHSKVPDPVCEGCHVTADTAKWQRIKQTAGHRVHLESDSSALDKVQCVTCHGAEVHRFRPVAETCGQSGCHKTDETRIVLGKMAVQTVRHCTSCHAFTADVPQLATTDSARGTMKPGQTECLGCHEMQTVLADFNRRAEPHGAKCGTCHNPHLQKLPADARTSCTTAGCHDNWRDTPFHVGDKHRRIGTQCTTCHVPHAAKVDASGCESCHRRVRGASQYRPPLPFDTLEALNRIRRATPPDGPPPPAAPFRGGEHPQGGPSADDDWSSAEDDGPVMSSSSAYAVRSAHSAPSTTALLYTAPLRTTALRTDLPAALPQDRRAAADSFPHARHTKVACLTCHGSGDGHGKLVFERPRGCQLCHHQDPAPGKCVSCHREERYARPREARVTITVPGNAPKPRMVTFQHARHASKPCTACHTTPVSMIPGPDKAACQGCHVEHHGAQRTCATCHQIADPKAAHTPIEKTHRQCDACHTPAAIAPLTPTRSLCGACHQQKASGHYDGRECTTCHFLATPEAYRARLTTPRS